MPVLKVVPRVNSKLIHFNEKSFENHQTSYVSSRSDVFQQNKRQGCTTQKTELGMHQNPHFQKKQLKIKKKSMINLLSTIKKSLFLSLLQ